MDNSKNNPNASRVNGRGGGGIGTEQDGRWRRVVTDGQRQFEHGRTIEMAKRIRLGRPVEAARSTGITLGMMLRPVVIGDDGSHRIRVRRVSFFNYQHSTLNQRNPRACWLFARNQCSSFLSFPCLSSCLD